MTLLCKLKTINPKITMKILLSSILFALAFATFAQLKPLQPGVYRWADRTLKVNVDRESGVFLEGTSPCMMDVIEISDDTISRVRHMPIKTWKN